jgi:hypothetical protein
MDQRGLLITAMVDECRQAIQTASQNPCDLPRALGPQHLLWMCDRIEEQAESWPRTKLHRWLGYVQGGLIANRMLRLDQIKKMFDLAKNAYGPSGDDEDLVDHLDAQTAFEMEIGGEG